MELTTGDLELIIGIIEQHHPVEPREKVLLARLKILHEIRTQSIRSDEDGFDERVESCR